MNLTQEVLGTMSDDDLYAGYTTLDYIRTAREGRGIDTVEVEVDLCWIEREQQLRFIRAQKHSNFLASKAKNTI